MTYHQKMVYHHGRSELRGKQNGRQVKKENTLVQESEGQVSYEICIGLYGSLDFNLQLPKPSLVFFET